jgi:hypothetical protein
MTLSYRDLKNSKASRFDKLNQELAKLNTPYETENKDEFWTVTKDKAEVGYATIRFLPGGEGDDLGFVRLYKHGFKGPGGWYIENSLTTLGQTDPVSEMNYKLWNEGGKAGQEIVSGKGKDQPGTKRKTEFISNIYVISDPLAPENEGKVFKFKYGPKIFGMLNGAMNPKFPTDPKFDPFDLEDGANFNLKVSKADYGPNYDASTFSTPAPLSEDEDKLDDICTKLYSLHTYLDPKNFKSYATLKARLEKVRGVTLDSSDTGVAESAPPKQKEAEAKPQPQSRVKAAEPDYDDDDDDMAMFQRLASDS